MDYHPDWSAALFSLSDYQSAIRAELDFLRNVADHVHLTVSGAVLNNAIRRYETLWLPLLRTAASGNDSQLVPPLDVHWVWHCHMLSPASYREDCLKLVGAVLDHSISWPTAYQISYSNQKWCDSFQGEPYEVTTSPGLTQPIYVQQSSYDLTAACVRQATFYYNVSLPHYKDKGFVNNAVQRYKKFLYLRKCHPGQFIVPCYDIDLVWHTHQLHPLVYADDTQKYLGSVFNHDDTDTDRGPSSKLSMSCDETRKLWKAVFNEEFSLSGAMYRGVSPMGRLAVMSPEQVSALLPREGRINIESVVADRPPASKLTLAISANGLTVAKHFKHNSSRVSPTSVSWSGTPVVSVAFRSTTDRALTFKLKHGAPCQCFAFGAIKYQCHCQILQFLPNDGGQVGERRPFRLQREIGTATLHLEGFVAIESLLQEAVLDVELGPFANIAMPEPAELLWGPTPIGSLPPGASNACLVATHRLFSHSAPGSTSVGLSVRIVHCLPLLMSAAQVFVGQQMVALAHLVGPDQVPDSSLPVIDVKEKSILLNCRIGERCLVIKNNHGDWGFVFGSWANMKQGVPATKNQRAVRGNPGNLQIRFVKLQEDLNPVIIDVTRQQKFIFRVPGTELNLASGQIKVDSEDIAERIALAFSVAVLNVLCQPPPPGVTPPRKHGDLGKITMPTVNPPAVMRGQRRIMYFDAGTLALVAAAGWMLSTPCNHYIAAWRRHRRTGDNCDAGGGDCDWPSGDDPGLDVAEICTIDWGETPGCVDGVMSDCSLADTSLGGDAFAGCGGCGGSCGGGGPSSCGGGPSSCSGGGNSSCGGGGTSSCGGGGGTSSCGGGGGTSSCGGGGSSSGGGSSCGGGGSSCGGGGSSCGGGGSSCGGGGSS